MTEAYPLQWPEGWPRTPAVRRKSSPFKISMGRARDELLASLGLMGVKQIVLSTMIPVRNDGLPFARFATPKDPGVAVYFERAKIAQVIACDTYLTVEANVRALGLTVDALRGLSRWGASQLLDRAFTGFTALPPTPAPKPMADWWIVLGVSASARFDEIRQARNVLAQKYHPDNGTAPDPERMALVNVAYSQACEHVDGAH